MRASPLVAVDDLVKVYPAKGKQPAVEAVRGKPNSSISVMCKLASKGEADLELWAATRHAAALSDLLQTRIVFELKPGRRASKTRRRAHALVPPGARTHR